MPPDYFSATGQRWGNPLYGWDAHAERRLSPGGWRASRARFELVDIVRIDHFRGFAALLGDPRRRADRDQRPLGPGPASALFEALRAAARALPIIAEDLGLITPEVEALRDDFGLPGMRVLQFAFGGTPTTPTCRTTALPNSVAYTGTHDNDTTLGWWNRAEGTAPPRAGYLGCDGRTWAGTSSAPCAPRRDPAIVPMQDVLGLGGEHRMNLPGRSEGYWEWRFEWAQVQPAHAQRLAALCGLYGR